MKALSADDGRDVYEMLQELPREENGFVNSANGLSFGEYKTWLERCRRDAEQKGIVDGWRVPQSTFWLYADGRPVGIGKIRHFLTEALRREGGTIGYAVRPSERGKGFGKALLAALLEKCRELSIDRALLTVREDNVPSLRTALTGGGVLEKTENGRHYIWVDLK